VLFIVLSVFLMLLCVLLLLTSAINDNLPQIPVQLLLKLLHSFTAGSIMLPDSLVLWRSIGLYSVILMVFDVRDGSSNIHSHLYEPENFSGKRVILPMRQLPMLKKRCAVGSCSCYSCCKLFACVNISNCK